MVAFVLLGHFSGCLGLFMEVEFFLFADPVCAAIYVLVLVKYGSNTYEKDFVSSIFKRLYH